MRILNLKITRRTERDRRDPSKCYVASEEVSFDVDKEALKKLGNMVVVSYDEGSDSCDKGPLFSVCNSRIAPYLVDVSTGRLYALVIDRKSSSIIHSNAREVCDNTGCRLVEACPVETEEENITVRLEPLGKEEAREALELADVNERPELALTYLIDEIDSIIGLDVASGASFTRESQEKLRELFRVLEEAEREQAEKLGSLPATIGELLESLGLLRTA